MSRLPKPGSDSGTWGDILNDYLSQEHNTDGSLKNVVRPSDTRLTDQRTPTDGSVTDAKISAGGLSPGLIIGGVPPDASYPSTANIRYVDYTNGSDSNNGLSPKKAFKTIQAAYNSLPTDTTTRQGQLYLLPGGHDVGSTGLLLDRRKPVTIEGLGRGHRWVSGSGQTTIATVTSNLPYIHTTAGSPPAALVDISTPASTSTNGEGFEFRNIAFAIEQAGVKYAINAPSCNYGTVDNCLFWAGSAVADHDAIGVYVHWDSTLGADASWWRITNNLATHIALCQMGNPAQPGNANRHVIRENQLSGNVGVVGEKPAIALYTNHGTVVRDNGVEGYTVGILFDGCTGCQESGDAGEELPTFILAQNSTHTCSFYPNGSSSGGSHDEILIQFDGDYTNGNMIMAPVMGSPMYDLATAIVDNSLTKRNLIICAGSDRVLANIRLPGLIIGTGDPESNIVGMTGDRYQRLDGALGTYSYVKRTGTNTTTGWVSEGGIHYNAGSPEGVVTASVGELCADTVAGRLYIKATGTGNTGWTKVETQHDIGASNLAVARSAADGTTIATASITPTANSLLIAVVESTITAGTPAAPTVTGNGLTWVQVATAQFNTTSTKHSRLTVFRAMGSAPTAGVVTADWGATTQNLRTIMVDQFTNVDTSGTNGSGAVVQSVATQHDSATTHNVTLATLANPNNASYAIAFAKAGVAITLGTGLTLIGTQAGGADTQKSFYEIGSVNPIVGTTVAVQDSGVIGVEIAIAP